MALAPGTRLGVYEIVSPLGAGGMGEVYRAHDTKLDRDVALKVLLPEVADNPERLARFRREAQILASLNHPNIAHIHGIEEQDGIVALVLELVEGATLADRIAKGPISLDEALPIAKQIAEALEAAHEQGIIHRDLKPANLKVREDGTVKVLDFGLARAIEPVAASGASTAAVTNSPTITSPALMTSAGMLIGTAAYMSPEQAKGKPADKRSDIWAFGCVLYEMLTGSRAFEGDEVAETLASILRTVPDWARLPADLPPQVGSLLKLALQKERQRRLSDIAAAKILLSEEFTAIATRPDAAPSFRWRTVAASLPIAIAVLAAGWWLRPSPKTPPLTKGAFIVELPDGQVFTNTTRSVIAISPDGSKIVYVADRRLYLRTLDDVEPQEISGTQSSDGPANPVFSPDGEWIAFHAGSDLTLKKVRVRGGAVTTLCNAISPFGLVWHGSSILFGQAGASNTGASRGIFRVAENGSGRERIVPIADTQAADLFQVLPDGDTLLMTIAEASNKSPGNQPNWDDGALVAVSLRTGEKTSVLEHASGARYVSTGHLLFTREGIVYAVRFDLKKLRVIGEPMVVIEGVRRANASQTGLVQLALADNGTLAYLPGPKGRTTSSRSVVLTSPAAAITTLPLPVGFYEQPRFSLDGRTLAVVRSSADESNVFTYDLSAAKTLQRLTLEGRNRFPVWSPDGRLAFQSDREGDAGIFAQRADGVGTAQRLTRAETGTEHIPESWSPDGATLLFTKKSGGTFALWILAVKTGETEPFDSVRSAEPIGAVFSPDGRWVAYGQNDRPGGIASPDRGVYVRPFPPNADRYQVTKISRDFHPIWPSANQLFFTPTVGRLSVTPVQTRPELRFLQSTDIRGAPNTERLSTDYRDMDVAADGRMVAAITLATSPQYRVILNWVDELRQRVPTQ